MYIRKVVTQLEIIMESYLDQLARIPSVSRIVYGHDKDNKPNDHCNWERELPTVDSPMAWVENDAHFRSRIKEISERNRKDQS